MRFAEMLFNFLAILEPRRVGDVQTNELRFETLVFNPLFDDGFVLHDFHARFEFLKLHSRKTFRVKFAELVLVIVIIRRAENRAAHSTLANKRVNTLWRISG